MKKIFLFLLCLLLPMELVAMDHCTHPGEYTVDKRCYVTNEQKKIKPFNAVAGVIGYYGIGCTGSVVKDGDDLFLYTAKHCVRGRKNIDVKLPNGIKATAYLMTCGDYETIFTLHGQEGINNDGDWAILKFDNPYLDFVNISKHPKDKKAVSVGYGSLKIMSDKEITDFKNQYIEFLKNNDSPYSFYDEKGKLVDEGKITVTPENKEKYGFIDDGISYMNGYVQWFLSKSDFYDKFCGDTDNMKVSYCEYDFDENIADGCQVWEGDSGGGLFDADGDFMAMRSSGTAVIGGTNHASAQDADGYVQVCIETE